MKEIYLSVGSKNGSGEKQLGKKVSFSATFGDENKLSVKEISYIKSKDGEIIIRHDDKVVCFNSFDDFFNAIDINKANYTSPASLKEPIKQDTVKILIEVQGGLAQNAYSNIDDVEIVIIDRDAEDLDDDTKRYNEEETKDINNLKLIDLFY